MPDDVREQELRRLREQELRLRRMAAPPPDRSRDIRRKQDLVEMAGTPWGRRIFRRWLFAYRDMPYVGRQDDIHRLGLRTPGVELEKELKAALPRDLFLEVIYPEKEDEHV